MRKTTTSFALDIKLKKLLERVAKKRGILVSELIRQILTENIENYNR